MRGKMIQSVVADPAVVVRDFSILPDDADFAFDEVIYTMGGKFKQRYMLRKDYEGAADYIIGNYQWNTELQRWQPYAPYKDWYMTADEALTLGVIDEIV